MVSHRFRPGSPASHWSGDLLAPALHEHPEVSVLSWGASLKDLTTEGGAAGGKNRVEGGAGWGSIRVRIELGKASQGRSPGGFLGWHVGLVGREDLPLWQEALVLCESAGGNYRAGGIRERF